MPQVEHLGCTCWVCPVEPNTTSTHMQRNLQASRCLQATASSFSLLNLLLLLELQGSWRNHHIGQRLTAASLQL